MSYPGMIRYKQGDPPLTVDNYQVIRTPSDEQALKEGYFWDPVFATYVSDWIEEHTRLTDGKKWAGQNLRLLDWQKDAIWTTFGWVNDEGERRHTSSFQMIPKKQGKTSYLAGVVNYAHVGDEEPGAQIYLGAVDRDQAGNLFKMVKAAVEQDEYLANACNIVESRNTIHGPDYSFVRTMSKEANAKDGFSPHCVVFDELHRFNNSNRKLWEVMCGADLARDEALKFVITTAGNDFSGICYEQYEYTRRVLEGEIIDISHTGVLYGAEEGDDPNDEATWFKANPSLGYTVSLKKFRENYIKQYKHGTEASKNDWLRKHLNIWVANESGFIPGDIWAKAGIKDLTLDMIPEGTPCYIGVDLASTSDLTSVCLLFGSVATGAFAFSYNWAPEAACLRRERENRGRFQKWASEGYLFQTPGTTTDHREATKFVVDIARRFNVRWVYMDPAQGNLMQTDLMNAGVPVRHLRQSFFTISEPTKVLDQYVRQGKIVHAQNPVLDWAMGNCRLIQDTLGNHRIDRSSRREKIDPVAALIDSVAGAIHDYGEKPAPEQGVCWVGD